MRKAFMIMICACFVLATGSILAATLIQQRDGQGPEKNVANAQVSESLQQNLLPSSSLSDVFKKVENSVVQITATRADPNQHIIINGVPSARKNTALGSGFVYDKQGNIITNYHVVAEATNADVTFVDGNTYSAKVIGKDQYGDLALLQITDDFSQEKLQPLPIANSSNVQVGEQVIAIGNPFGLSATMTTGIVSQIGRLLPNADSGYSIPNTIQTDAAINPGNSGGPLLNAKGEVIAMNTAIFSSTGAYSGVGFAVPSNSIMRELPSLIKTGTYQHPWVGISGGKIPSSLAKSMSLSPNYKGVLVASVQSGGPADRAGLKGLIQNDNGDITSIGDIITAIDGHPVRQIDDIINYVEQYKKVGENIKLTVLGNGKTIEMTATLGDRSSTQTATTGASRPQLPFGLGPIPELPQIPGLPQLRLPPLFP